MNTSFEQVTPHLSKSFRSKDDATLNCQRNFAPLWCEEKNTFDSRSYEKVSEISQVFIGEKTENIIDKILLSYYNKNLNQNSLDETIEQSYFSDKLEQYSFKTSKISQKISKKSTETTQDSQPTQTCFGWLCKKLLKIFHL